MKIITLKIRENEKHFHHIKVNDPYTKFPDFREGTSTTLSESSYSSYTHFYNNNKESVTVSAEQYEVKLLTSS